MSKILDDILAANRAHVADFGFRTTLSVKPSKQFAILTCMDARMDPAKFAGISEGDAHVIRNAGGRASDDAIRSLVVSHKLLGTLEWFVIQHTNCGLGTITDEVMGELLEETLQTAEFKDGSWRNTGNELGSTEGHHVKWLTIQNLKESVREDVEQIANHPLVSQTVSIYGLIYHPVDGRLEEVERALRIGRKI